MNNNHELHHTYSDNITHKRIFIIGPTPPPLGGVSVHVKRVIAKLKQQHNTVYQINPEALYRFSFLRKIPFKYGAQIWYFMGLCAKIFYYQPDMVIYHSFCARNSIPELMIITALKKIISYTSVLIEHDCRHMYQRSRRWKQWFSSFLTQCDQLVCIGDITHKSYGDNSITIPLKVNIESAFLPPILSEEKAICATYPPALFTFLATHKLIIVVNAFQLTLWQGRDLYGIEQAIEMIKNIKESYSTIGLIIVLGSVGDEQYYQLLMERIETYVLHDAIFIMCGQKELWPLLKYAMVFIRPTLSDGYSVSIEEALYLGTLVVASDVCKRPVGTVLYKVGDMVDLSKKVKDIVQKKEHFHARQGNAKHPNKMSTTTYECCHCLHT